MILKSRIGRSVCHHVHIKMPLPACNPPTQYYLSPPPSSHGRATRKPLFLVLVCLRRISMAVTFHCSLYADWELPGCVPPELQKLDNHSIPKPHSYGIMYPHFSPPPSVERRLLFLAASFRKTVSYFLISLAPCYCAKRARHTSSPVANDSTGGTCHASAGTRVSHGIHPSKQQPRPGCSIQ